MRNYFRAIGNRNCLLKHVIEGNIEERIEVMGRRGRRSTQLPDDLKIKRVQFRLEEELLDRSVWRIRFGRVYGPFGRQATEWLNE